MNQQQHQTRNLQRRGPCWFEHEINQLLQLVNEHGQDWNKIGTLLETKTAQDCRKKFAELNNKIYRQYSQLSQLSFLRKIMPIMFNQLSQ
ncbi:unnamed protein product [Rhizophagus irregularis]|nr:unnamed protein product [Rhizophagus irregularis]CAB4412024.1 unnamed protein product [Rhizophagus irregularis]CAB4490473.1 unnamed protein product [Rhizophagus irregularis]